MARFGRVLTAMITPFDHDGALDLDGAAKLASWLVEQGNEGLVVAGVSTSSCVETTARDAADRGWKVVIVEDATAELDEPSHDATLRQFAVRFGRVWTVEETLSVLGLSGAAPAMSPGPLQA